MSSFPVGAPGDRASLVGPLISAQHLGKVHGYVSRAIDAGARAVLGGHPLEGPGHFYPPTLIVDAAQDSEIVQSEIFGPVLVALPFDDDDEAVALANDSEYGLAASVWTRDHQAANRLASRLDVGVIWINDHLPLTSEMPHGGTKKSGFGRDMGPEALLEYSTVKHVMSRLDPIDPIDYL